jgi:hypothetical protein
MQNFTQPPASATKPATATVPATSPTAKLTAESKSCNQQPASRPLCPDNATDAVEAGERGGGTGDAAAIDHFSLFYTVDGGNSWERAGYAGSADRTFSWTVPARFSSRVKVIMYAMDASSNLLSDALPAAFVITPAIPSPAGPVTSLALRTRPRSRWMPTGPSPSPSPHRPQSLAMSMGVAAFRGQDWIPAFAGMTEARGNDGTSREGNVAGREMDEGW